MLARNVCEGLILLRGLGQFQRDPDMAACVLDRYGLAVLDFDDTPDQRVGFCREHGAEDCQGQKDKETLHLIYSLKIENMILRGKLS
jgi:hypothetical protein